MSNKFQLEFSLSKEFQSKLENLMKDFCQFAGHSLSVNKVAGMCLRALSDITPELIDKYLSDEKDDIAVDIFQKTTNLDQEERDLLDNLKLNLLLKHKRDISRRDIMLGLIYTASGLKKSDIEYIYSEYQ